MVSGFAFGADGPSGPKAGSLGFKAEWALWHGLGLKNYSAARR